MIDTDAFKRKQLEILRELDRVCREKDIHYYLAYGSCLGAIRHKGFIPWDDDIDLGIPRADYDKFLQIAPKELSTHLKLINYHGKLKRMITVL